MCVTKHQFFQSITTNLIEQLHHQKNKLKQTEREREGGLTGKEFDRLNPIGLWKNFDKWRLMVDAETMNLDKIMSWGLEKFLLYLNFFLGQQRLVTYVSIEGKREFWDVVVLVVKGEVTDNETEIPESTKCRDTIVIYYIIR